jgi:outer membrane protein TolC
MLTLCKRRTVPLVLLLLLLQCFNRTSPAQSISAADEQNLPERKIGLPEALNAASLLNPELHSQQLRALLAKANSQIDRALFDKHLAVTLSQNNQQTPLTPAQINENYPFTSPVLKTHATDLRFTVNKLFHNGITLNGSADATRVVDNETQLQGVNLTTYMTGVTVPLLQGRGSTIVNAALDASLQEESAVRDDTDQFLQQLLVSSAQAYWSLAAAQEMTHIAQDAEVRGRRYVEDLKAYIDANRVPANDLNQALANLDSRSSDLAAQQQNAFAQQEQLKLLTGIIGEPGFQRLVATDILPTTSNATYLRPSARSLELLYQHALNNRRDYRAAVARVTEAQRLLKAAQQAVLPTLNANAQAGYSGLAIGRGPDDFLKASALGIPGPVAMGTLSYSHPLGNNEATGKLLQASTTVRQSQLALDSVQQQIKAEVMTDANLLYTLGKQLQLAHDATSALEKSLSGEEVKFRAGITSVTDLLLLEDRLTSAYQQEIQIRMGYANAIILLNLAAGDLSYISTLQPGHIDPAGFLSPRYLQ